MNAKIYAECVKIQALRELILRRDPRRPQRALLQAGGWTIPAAIGRAGLTALKREGDGATPFGAMRLINGYYRADRVRLPQTRLSMRPIDDRMGWCDAPHHAAYNRPVQLPFSDNHERMMRDDGLYDICVVLDWNIRERRRHTGSAIFFHLAGPGHAPTEGCIAIERQAMLRLLPRLAPTTVVRVI